MPTLRYHRPLLAAALGLAALFDVSLSGYKGSEAKTINSWGDVAGFATRTVQNNTRADRSRADLYQGGKLDKPRRSAKHQQQLYTGH